MHEPNAGDSFTLALTLKVEVTQYDPWTFEKLKQWDEAYQNLPVLKRRWLAEALELAQNHPCHWERSILPIEFKHEHLEDLDAP